MKMQALSVDGRPWAWVLQSPITEDAYCQEERCHRAFHRARCIFPRSCVGASRCRPVSRYWRSPASWPPIPSRGLASPCGLSDRNAMADQSSAWPGDGLSRTDHCNSEDATVRWPGSLPRSVSPLENTCSGTGMHPCATASSPGPPTGWAFQGMDVVSRASWICRVTR